MLAQYGTGIQKQTYLQPQKLCKKTELTDQATCVKSSKFTHSFTNRLEDSLRKASAINHKLKEANSQNDTLSP